MTLPQQEWDEAWRIGVVTGIAIVLFLQAAWWTFRKWMNGEEK